LGKPKEAAKVFDQMVAANEGSFRAYLERARFRKETGATDGWEKDVRTAARLAPHEAEVVLAEAELLLKKNDARGARACLERGLKGPAKDARLFRSLADLELQTGR